MTSIKGHFDGTAVVLDEPAPFHVGQSVRVTVDPSVVGALFADRVVLPEFAALRAMGGDTTRHISADRNGTN